MQAGKFCAVNRFTVTLTSAMLCLGQGFSLAQVKPVAQQGWETTAAAGVTLTRGNSRTFLANLSLDTRRKWERDEAALGVSGGYGETTVNGSDQKNTEYLKSFGQYNRLFNYRLYGGVRLDGEYDGIAGVDYRFRVSPLIGYYVVKEPKTSLAFEVGPSVVLEKLKSRSSRIYLGARLGERFEHKLGDTTKVWQRLEYIPDVEHWTQKYLVIGEIGIDTAITRKLSLRAVLQDNYDNAPAAGRQKNDLRLITGMAYKF